jgi:SAM-dependent methyltransferase
VSEQDFEYVGAELELFADAGNWRRYWASLVAPFLGEHVLEVGAGIGSVAQALGGRVQTWTAVEPDKDLAERIPSTIDGCSVSTVVGTVASVPPDGSFDSVLYMDVLEHIDDDHLELGQAAERLRPGGHLVVLAPAHQWLFSPFDAAIGHFRRYNKRSLRVLCPEGCTEVYAAYLDSVGTLLSAGNRVLLRSTMPTQDQIRFWDRRLVPIARVTDLLTGRLVGKSILMIWRKNSTGPPQATR